MTSSMTASRGSKEVISILISASLCFGFKDFQKVHFILRPLEAPSLHLTSNFKSRNHKPSPEVTSLAMSVARGLEWC